MTRSLSIPVLFVFLGALGCGGGDDADTKKKDDDEKTTKKSDDADDKDDTDTGKLSVTKSDFGKLSDGTAIDLYTLTNSKGLTVEVINWGATIIGVHVPGKDGETANVTLHFDDIAGWESNPSYFGVVAGRYANRIAEGKFTLDDTEYEVTRNEQRDFDEPIQLLHGGAKGFDKQVWTAEPIEEEGTVGVALTYVSADGEEGFPGELTATVKYTLNDDNELGLEYEATTDKPTVVNLTNHCYWNLAGAGSGPVLDQMLELSADKYLPVAPDTLIPTGELKDVAETPYDFTEAKQIGQGVALVDGIDNCYVVNGEAGTLRHVATLTDPESGRTMTVESTEPGVQVYTADHLDGGDANNGYQKNAGLCLETNHFPDSPNQPDFPTTVLRPGETYTQKTVHHFGLVEE